MGTEDIQACSYMDDNRRFADVFNATFFQGKEVIDPNELREANKELLIPWTDNPQKVVRDNVKKWFHGMLLAIFVLENQHGIDYHMTIRNMLAEAMEYNRQWKEIKDKHRKDKDLS